MKRTWNGRVLLCVAFTVALTPLVMAPGCLPGTTLLPFEAFEYRVTGVFGSTPLGVQRARITHLDIGWYQLDMTVKEQALLGSLFCGDENPLDAPCAELRELPSRWLSDEELQRIVDAFANVEVATFTNPPDTPCGDPVYSRSYEWDDESYDALDGLCAQGEYTTLTNASREALNELVESLR